MANNNLITRGKITTAFDANGFAITNLPAPSAISDAVRKDYVDGLTVTAGRGVVLVGTAVHFAQSTAYTVGSLFCSSSASAVSLIDDVAVGNALLSGGVGASPTFGKIGLTTHVSGTLAVGNGGTGITAYDVGDIIVPDSVSTLSRIAAAATGNALISGGVATVPSWGKIGLTTHISGTLPVANGGTNITSYAVGDILQASGSTTLSKLASVATGNVLLSGGVTTVSAWGKVGLSTHVSGTLPVANGGTNLTSYTIGDLVQASGATTLASLSAVATGNVLLSGGVGTVSSWGKVTLTGHVSGILPIANGGSGTSTVFTAGSVLFAGAAGVYSQDNTGLFYDSTNKSLGIGTGSPGVGRIKTSFVPTASTGTIANCTLATYPAPTASGDVVVMGCYAQTLWNSGYNTTQYIAGFMSQGGNMGVGTVANGVGLYTQGRNIGGGTVTILDGVEAVLHTSSSSVTTTGNGVRIQSPLISTGGTIGTCNGLNIETIAQAGITTARAIWQQGTSDLNDIMGKTGLGIASSTSSFCVLAASTSAISSARFTAGTGPTSPVDGDMWLDSTRKKLGMFNAGIKQFVGATLGCQAADYYVTNSTSELTLLGSMTPGAITLPANFWTVSKTLRIRGMGYINMEVGVTGRWRLKVGSVVLLDTTAVTVGTTTSGKRFEFDFLVGCVTTGATGTLFAQGTIRYNNSSTEVILPLVTTSATTVDTTASAALDFTLQYGTATVNNKCAVTNCFVEVLN